VVLRLPRRRWVQSPVQQRSRRARETPPLPGGDRALTPSLDYRSWLRFTIQRFAERPVCVPHRPGVGVSGLLIASVAAFRLGVFATTSRGQPPCATADRARRGLPGVYDDSRRNPLASRHLRHGVVMTKHGGGCYPQDPGSRSSACAADVSTRVLVTPWRWDGRNVGWADGGGVIVTDARCTVLLVDSRCRGWFGGARPMEKPDARYSVLLLLPSATLRKRRAVERLTGERLGPACRCRLSPSRGRPPPARQLAPRRAGWPRRDAPDRSAPRSQLRTGRVSRAWVPRSHRWMPRSMA